jgi:glycosyltransferase involved in cell wall biosynthesis
MIRVLYVSRFDRDTSADGLYSDDLTNALGRTGEVDVIRGAIQASDNSGLDGEGPGPLGGKVAALAKAEDADLLHLHYEPGLYSPRAVLSLRKASRAMPPVVVTLHRVAGYNGRLKPSGIRQARAVGQEWLLAKFARMFLVHAEHSAAIVRKRYPKVRCEAHPMPVPDDTCNAPRKGGGPVLYYGNHHPGKGILEFVKAVRATPDLKAIVAGRRHPRWAK